MSGSAGAPSPAGELAGDLASPLIAFRAVVKRFGTVAAVDGIDLAIGAGEFFGLLGPSGCGKTTLLRILAGFEAPTSGSVAIGGVDLAGTPPHRRPVNMMFQSYALFPHMSVERNVAFGLKMAGIGRDDIRRRVSEMLDLVQLAGLGKRAPHQLSGGQRQRVALARALARRPKVLLLDEPLSALDKKLRQETRFELVRIQKELGITFVIVTHDQEEALSLCDRIAVMNHGRIEQLAPPAELYERPATRWVASFIGTVNLLEVRVAGQQGRDLRLDAGGRSLRLEAPDAPPAMGEPAWLALRPEELRLSRQPDGVARNSLHGTLRQIAYYGERSIYGVEVDGCGMLLVSVSERLAEGQCPAIGEPAAISWDASAGRLLTR